MNLPAIALVGRMLADKVELGICIVAKALDIAKALFHDNPVGIFRLGDAG